MHFRERPPIGNATDEVDFALEVIKVIAIVVILILILISIMIIVIVIGS